MRSIPVITYFCSFSTALQKFLTNYPNRPLRSAHVRGAIDPSRVQARTDDELLAAHVAGDRHAFSTLVTRHHDHLWAVALRTTGDPDDAADALQDALISAYRTASGFRSDAKVSSWLHRIVVNASLYRLRRNGTRRTVPLIDNDHTGPVGPNDYDRIELGDAIRSALDELPAAQRAAVIAVDVEGYSISEAAMILGVPEGTIKSRCSRARTRLARTLGYLRGDSAVET